MSHSVLQWLRLVTPGLILLILWGMLGWITSLWGLYWPDDPKNAVTGLGVILIGAIYYVMPLRHWSNQRFFKNITETLRHRLIEISGESDDLTIFTWKRLRGIFYSLIDNDVSLKVKASQAYFNGYIWTSLADLRVLSALMTVPSIILGILGVTEAWFAAGTFAVIALLTIPASFATTKNHKSIGEQQIEIIEVNHLDSLREKLKDVRERSNRSHSSNEDSA